MTWDNWATSLFLSSSDFRVRVSSFPSVKFASTKSLQDFFKASRVWTSCSFSLVKETTCLVVLAWSSRVMFVTRIASSLLALAQANEVSRASFSPGGMLWAWSSSLLIPECERAVGQKWHTGDRVQPQILGSGLASLYLLHKRPAKKKQGSDSQISCVKN